MDPLDVAFAANYRLPKEAIVHDAQGPDGGRHAVALRQLGARSVAFGGAPRWPTHAGLADEAIIETFVVDAAGVPTALSESVWLERWRQRGEAMVRRVHDACREFAIPIEAPGYLTCSITPVELLEGNPHLDDDQLIPGVGIGLIAIDGQHCGTRVVDTDLIAAAPVRPGPVVVDDDVMEAHRGRGDSAGGPDEIVFFTSFAQVHAGPTPADMPTGATHRQLLVYRAGTVPDPI